MGLAFVRSEEIGSREDQSTERSDELMLSTALMKTHCLRQIIILARLIQRAWSS